MLNFLNASPVAQLKLVGLVTEECDPTVLLWSPQ